MTPKVSVIIPMWNGEATIRAAITSLQRQTLEDWEAIVVDDGSTDHGAEVARRAAQSDARLRIVSQQNRGLSATRNTGLEKANGEFIQFLDADDTLPADSLEILSVRAEAGTGAAFGAFSWIEEGDEAAPFVVDISTRIAGFHELLQRNRFPVHAAMVARSLIGDVRFDESLRAAEDWDLWLRLAQRGVKWVGVDDEVAHYHLTPGSMSRDDERMLDAMLMVVKSAFAAARVAETSDCAATRDREKSVCARLALECATAASLTDHTARADHAWELLGRALYAQHGMEASAAANAAYWVIPHAARRTPDAWTEMNPQWISSVGRLWMNCERRGVAKRGFLDEAMRRLAEQLVRPDTIAQALAQRALGATDVQLVGYGRNGRRVANALRDSGIAFTVRDDALPSGGDCNLSDFATEKIVPIEGVIVPGALVIVTPEDDHRILPRLAFGATIVRWTDERSALSDDNARRIGECLAPAGTKGCAA